MQQALQSSGMWIALSQRATAGLFRAPLGAASRLQLAMAPKASCRIIFISQLCRKASSEPATPHNPARLPPALQRRSAAASSAAAKDAGETQQPEASSKRAKKANGKASAVVAAAAAGDDRAPGERRYFLMKSEPDVFSIDDLASKPDQTEHWDGGCSLKACAFASLYWEGSAPLSDTVAHAAPPAVTRPLPVSPPPRRCAEPPGQKGAAVHAAGGPRPLLSLQRQAPGCGGHSGGAPAWGRAGRGTGACGGAGACGGSGAACSACRSSQPAPPQRRSPRPQPGHPRPANPHLAPGPLAPPRLQIVREAYPDHTQFDSKSEYYDASST